MAYPSLPASPTLTNPDMILPYGEYDSTPSPPQDPMQLEIVNGGWKGPIPDDMAFSLGPPGHMQLGLGAMTPTTPIIYGNGTMLSDIGEVTEAESTPGRKPKSTHSRAVRDRDSPVRSSPTIGYEAMSKRKIGNHHRSVSMETTSTATTEGQAAEMFKDFDDGISVDDSNFQGDDEESVMDESYENEPEVAQAKIITRKESRLINTDDVSSAALSRRAEMILANAKKRLDNMEGNLTRARSSLYITPSSSMSSIHSSSPLSRSTPSPPDADRRIVAGLGVPPARHRQTNNLVNIHNSPGHMRVFSETSVPSALQSLPLVSVSPALSPESPVNGGQDGKDDVLTPFTASFGRNSGHLTAPLLEPLSEDEAEPSQDIDRGSIRASTAEPQSNISFDHRGLTRSTSSMQMRDLTDKMKDLKGKISTLRDRAREDNLKRRSLQSLRTPSPFTAAEQWYTSSKAYKGGVNGGVGVAHNPWNGEPSVTDDVDGDDEQIGEQEVQKDEETEDDSVYQDVEDEEYIEAQPEIRGLDHEGQHSNSEQDDSYDTAVEGEEIEIEGDIDREANGDPYDDELVHHNELDEYQSESDASLYHDSLVAPISHEDREDAFDYEHFFLHSAMGTISQQRLARRGSQDSFSSEDSVETTRGPEAPAAVAKSDELSDSVARGHVRGQKSTESVSTLASFATATEGRRSSEFQDSDNRGDYAVKSAVAPYTEEPGTSVVEKRSTFGKSTPTAGPESDQPPSSPISRPTSVIRASSAQAAKLHHASVSSFASTGTNRSFPLVNKPKSLILEPRNSIISEAITINGVGGQTSPVEMLAKEDQILVERLVASLGKCVLGLQEAGRASSEGRMWRRRLDAARRVLEGQEGAV